MCLFSAVCISPFTYKCGLLEWQYGFRFEKDIEINGIVHKLNRESIKSQTSNCLIQKRLTSLWVLFKILKDKPSHSTPSHLINSKLFTILWFKMVQQHVGFSFLHQSSRNNNKPLQRHVHDRGNHRANAVTPGSPHCSLVAVSAGQRGYWKWTSLY